MTPLFAVHLSDGLLDWPWLIGGFLLLAGLLALGSLRLTDRDIPRIGVLSAAFFVASQVHLPLGGFSVHLLLNGLLGVVLRQHATLAITVGLLLQSLLFGHGGLTLLGVNGCTMAIPAVLAGFLFPILRASPLRTSRVGRSAGVFAVAVVWLGFAVTAGQILAAQAWGAGFDFRDPPPLWALDPFVLAGIAGASAVLTYLERRLESDPDFALGLFVGLFTAGLTVLLTATAVWVGGKGDLRALAALGVATHIPVIAIEGLGVGFAVAVLAKAKPEWLGGSRS
jgi:ABC-type Co2+ transport system permease subunit